MRTIDLTPTWMQFGVIYERLATSGQHKALDKLRPELMKAMACAEAMSTVLKELPDELKEKVEGIIRGSLEDVGL